MAVVTNEEFMKQLNEILKDNDSDEALSVLENASDTFNDLSKQISEAGDWKTKYEENDKAWKSKYRERFSKPSTPINGTTGSIIDEEDDVDETDDNEPEKLTYDALFK